MHFDTIASPSLLRSQASLPCSTVKVVQSLADASAVKVAFWIFSLRGRRPGVSYQLVVGCTDDALRIEAGYSFRVRLGRRKLLHWAEGNAGRDGVWAIVGFGVLTMLFQLQYTQIVWDED